MPDVRLPDGTIIKNVPEGTTKQQLIEKLEAKDYDVSGLKPEQPTEEATGLSESNLDNYLAGIGRAMVDLSRGAQQRIAEIGSKLPETPLLDGIRERAEARREELQREVALARQRDAALRSNPYGLAGELTGSIAALAPLGGVATTIPRAIAAGAAEGALMPTAEQGELANNMVVGAGAGAAGNLAARGLSRLVSPFGGQQAGRARQVLEDAGVNLDVAQRTGKEGAQRFRSALGDLPMTASAMRRFNQQQRRQFTRAVLKTIDIDGDELSPDLLNRAFNSVSDSIDEAVKQTPVRVDDELLGTLTQMLDDIPLSVGDDAAANALMRNINKITTGDVIPGNVFINVRSNLSKLSQKTPVAREVQDAMMDALERSSGNPRSLQDALAKYRNIRILQNSIEKSTDKTISPKRLVNTLYQQRNRSLSQRRLGHPRSIELVELAEAGADLIPETIGNSGTFARTITGEMLLGGGAAGAAGLAGYDMEDALKVGVGAAALPYLAQRGMTSQGAIGNYLAGGAQTGNILDTLIRQGIISGGLINEQNP